MTLFSVPLPSADEMSHFDYETIDRGFASLELMEKAGTALAECFSTDLSRHGLALSAPIVLCGPGNNGGDGLVVARHWLSAGVTPTVLLAESSSLSADCETNLARFLEAGGKALRFEGSTEVAEALASLPTVSQEMAVELLSQSSVVVDALLGNGQTGPPSRGVKPLCEIMQKVSSCGPQRRYAVDLPTGMNATTGEVYENAIQANFTGTVQFVKRGMTQGDAREICGEVEVLDIGILATQNTAFSSNSSEPFPHFPVRRYSSHKYANGKVIVVAGSHRMPGAAALAAMGALGSGVGIVEACFPKGMDSTHIPPEVIRRECSEEGGMFSLGARDEILEALSKASGVVVGPGLGRSEAVSSLIHSLSSAASSESCPFVLDADALRALNPKQRGQLHHSIITPHEGEASQLLGIGTTEVRRDRFSCVSELQVLTGGVALLKGAGTLLTDGSEGFVDLTGSPLLAVAGSGDVLSGILGGMVAQGMSPLDAARASVEIHGRAARLASEMRGGALVTASEICSEVSRARAQLVAEQSL